MTVKKAVFSSLVSRYCLPMKRHTGDHLENSSINAAIVKALEADLDADGIVKLRNLLDFLPPEASDISEPRRELLRILGDKWSVFILLILSAGPFRHAPLRRAIRLIEGGDGISQPVLTQKLRNLERNGLVVRTVFDEIPPQVQYSLTEFGCEFVVRSKDLIAWMGEFVAVVESARIDFDTMENERLA